MQSSLNLDGNDAKIDQLVDRSPSNKLSKASPYQSLTTIRSRNDDMVGLSVSMHDHERRNNHQTNIQSNEVSNVQNVQSNNRPSNHIKPSNDPRNKLAGRQLHIPDDHETITTPRSGQQTSKAAGGRRDSTVLQATLALFSPKRSPAVGLTLQEKIQQSLTSPVNQPNSQSIAPMPDNSPKFVIPFLESLDVRSMKNLKTYFTMHSINLGESTAVRGMHIIVKGSIKIIQSNNQQTSGNERIFYEKQNGEWFSDIPHLIAFNPSDPNKGPEYDWRDVRAIALQSSFVLSCSVDRWEAFCIRYPAARVCANVYDQSSKRSLPSPARHHSIQHPTQPAKEFTPPPLLRRVTAPSLEFPLKSGKSANDSPLTHRLPVAKSQPKVHKENKSSLLVATSYDEYTLCLDSVAIFQSINQLQLIQLRSLFVCYEVEANEVIFNEGDPSIGLYLIVSGRVNVIVSNRSDRQPSVQSDNPSDEAFVHVDTLTSRHIFGEIGCLNQVPRTATVKAIQRTRMLFINQSNLFQLIKLFPHLLGQNSLMRALMSHRINQSLRTLSFFDSLAVKQVGPMKLFDSRIDQVSQYFTWGVYRKGEVVYQVDDPSDLFFLVYNGGATVYSMPQNKEEWTNYTQSLKSSSDQNNQIQTVHPQFGILIDQLSRGDFFGALGLVHSVPRTSTVVSNQSTLVLKCRAQSFYAMFGPSNNASNSQSVPPSIIQSLESCRQLIDRSCFRDVTRQLNRIPLFQSIRENHAFSKLDLISSLMVYRSYSIDPENPSKEQSIYSEGERLTSESRVHVLIRGDVELWKRFDAPSNPYFENLVSQPQDKTNSQNPQSGTYEFLVQTVKPGEWFGDTGLPTSSHQPSQSPSNIREIHLQSARVSQKQFNRSVLTVSMTRSQFHQICSLAPDLKQLFNQSINQSINLARLLVGIPLFARFIKENKPWSKAEIFASMLSINQSVKAGTIVSTASKFTILLIGCVDYRANQSISSPVMRLKSGAWFGERPLLLHESNFLASQQQGKSALSSPSHVANPTTPQSMNRLIDPDVCHVEATEDCILASLTHAQLQSFLKLAPELKEAFYALHPDIPNHLTINQNQNHNHNRSPKPSLQRTISPKPMVKDSVPHIDTMSGDQPVTNNTHDSTSPAPVRPPNAMSPIQEHQHGYPLLPPLSITNHTFTQSVNVNPAINATPVLPFMPVSPSLARSVATLPRLPPLSPTNVPSDEISSFVHTGLISQSFHHSTTNLVNQQIIEQLESSQPIPNGISSAGTSQTSSPIFAARALPRLSHHAVTTQGDIIG